MNCETCENIRVSELANVVHLSFVMCLSHIIRVELCAVLWHLIVVGPVLKIKTGF